MFINKTYKFKLKPTKTQERVFEEWLNVCRVVYNLCLEQKQVAYKQYGVKVTKFESYNQLPELKNHFSWVKTVYSDTLQQTIDRVYNAYDKFYAGGGYPKFQRKGKYCSFGFKRNVVVEGSKVKLPKIGWIKFFRSRSVKGEIRTATIKKELKGWFITLCVRVPKPSVKYVEEPTGVDLGVSKFLVTSEGEIVENPKHFKSFEKTIRKLNRKISRQKKGSSSRIKTVHKLRKVHNKLKNKREDFLHKTSTSLVSNHNGLVVEDLKVSRMLGKDSQLSKNISDVGLHSFLYKLEYKSTFQGKPFTKVNPAYTSQKCSSCSYVDKRNRITQSDFKCLSCGFTCNADYNAAKNIQVSGRNFSTKAEPLG
jgi:putative transposase